MLRLAQPQQKSDNRNDNAAPPRSLEALLAVNTASSIGGRGSADASGLRSSVSSDWSPPSTRIALSRFSRSRQPSSDEGDVVVGTPGRDVCAAGTAGMQPSTAAAAAATGTGMEISATGSDADSNPPTPARMGFEGDEPPTPGGKNLAEAAPGSRDRCGGVVKFKRHGATVYTFISCQFCSGSAWCADQGWTVSILVNFFPPLRYSVYGKKTKANSK